MASGKYRHRIRVERLEMVSTPTGGQSEARVSVGDFRCRIEAQRSFSKNAERISNGGVSANPVVRIWVRSGGPASDIDATMVATNLDTNEAMNISSPAQASDDRGKELVFYATIGKPL